MAASLTIGVAWNGQGDPTPCFAAGLSAPFVQEILVSPMDETTAAKARAAANSKVRVLPTGDRGIYDAWNKLVNACSTSHIAFHGVDDLVAPEADLANVLAAAGPNDLLICSIQFATPQGKPTAVYHHRETEPPALSLGRLANPACPEVCWPISAIRSVGGLDTSFRIAGDADLWFRVRPVAKRNDSDAILLTMLDGGASARARHARTVWLENRRIAKARNQTIPLGNRLLSGAFLNSRWLLYRLAGEKRADRLTDFIRSFAGKAPRFSLIHEPS